MATIILTNKASVFDPTDNPTAAAKQSGETLILDDVATAPAGTVFEVSDAVWAYNQLGKKSQKVFKILKGNDVADAGEYLDATLANWKQYTPPVVAKEGELGPAHQWQLAVDNFKVHAEDDLKAKTLKTLKKGTVRELRQIVGSNWYYDKADKGYVLIADNSGKFYWNLIASTDKLSGKVIDVNKKEIVTTTAAPQSKPASSNFGITPAAPAPTVIAKPEGGLSTPVILAIAGGVVLLLLLVTSPSGGGGRRTARA